MQTRETAGCKPALPPAAGSIGFTNSIGHLGGFLGPIELGEVEKRTASFVGGLYFLCASMLISSSIIFFLGLGRREKAKK